MQPPVYKVCPQCRQTADVNAQACAACGHVFRTQFANQTQFFQQPPQPPQSGYQNPPSPYYRPNPSGTQAGPDERSMAMVMWIVMIFAQFLSPLIFLVIAQNSPFVRANAIMALAVILFAICFNFAVGILSIFLGVFGLALYLLMLYPCFIMPIQGAIAARQGYLYEPPFIGRLVRSWIQI